MIFKFFSSESGELKSKKYKKRSEVSKKKLTKGKKLNKTHGEFTIDTENINELKSYAKKAGK
ncbi:MAG: hypothetical protein MHPSP_001992 [Paramarteilia canceri]